MKARMLLVRRGPFNQYDVLLMNPFEMKLVISPVETYYVLLYFKKKYFRHIDPVSITDNDISDHLLMPPCLK